MTKLFSLLSARVICFGSARSATNAPGYQGELEDDPDFEYPK